ncbi:hypothetical protein BOX15_Mlig025114g1 [Macrostomum lignano]|uniref:NAD(+) kinase n=1 Tax=Macrostomum lignano TaxID=282301 RepID=A0A267GYF3_9PLAT|nr:hypothetical protein BOX15_Mlig025114g1 [Macrostomum lignano]
MLGSVILRTVHGCQLAIATVSQCNRCCTGTKQLAKLLSSAATGGWCQPAMRFSQQLPGFEPRRLLLLTKITRLEYERSLNPHLSEEKLKDHLKRKGSDYDNLLLHHNIHHGTLNSLVAHLQQRGIDCQVVSRNMYTLAAINWADAVVSAGGDGTFLLAASRIKSATKPLIGVNTDPGKSEGYLCVPTSRTAPDAIDALLAGRFRWLWRQRIRVSMSTGLPSSSQSSADSPADGASRLQSLHLKYPEYRFSEHYKELEEAWLRRQPMLQCQEHELSPLPVLALNEVFIGESLSARVSYYEMGLGREGRMRKQKSSGVTVCTGTGSTSWYFHINHLSESQVEEILHYANQLADSPDGSGSRSRRYTPAEIASIARNYNSALTFDPELIRMAWAVRDPVVNSVFAADQCRGVTDLIRVRSRMWDARLVIDGDYAFSFNDGCVALLEMRPEDAICCVRLLD